MTARLSEFTEQLLALSPSEATPFLLELARAQTSRRRPRDLVQQYARDGFVQPSALDQRTIHRLDGIALEAAQDYDAVQLSPVAPLGVCSVIAPTSQDRTLSSMRATEVVSDPTNVLALECARRLKAEPLRSFRLCTAHQTVRAQPVPANAGFSRHFRLFALVEGGPALPDEAFEVEAVVRAVDVFERILGLSATPFGADFQGRAVTLHYTSARKSMATRIGDRLTRQLARLTITQRPFESRYYDGIRALFHVNTATGSPCQIGDVGVFHWMHKLTANGRHRFVAAGFGLQLIAMLFRRDASQANGP